MSVHIQTVAAWRWCYWRSRRAEQPVSTRRAARRSLKGPNRGALRIIHRGEGEGQSSEYNLGNGIFSILNITHPEGMYSRLAIILALNSVREALSEIKTSLEETGHPSLHPTSRRWLMVVHMDRSHRGGSYTGLPVS